MTEHLTDTELRELEEVRRRLEQGERLMALLERFYKALVLEHEQGQRLDQHTYLLLISDAQDARATWNGTP